jgi:hypothetical protein
MTGGGLSHVDWGRGEAVGGTARGILKRGFNDAQYRTFFGDLLRPRWKGPGLRRIDAHLKTGRIGGGSGYDRRCLRIGLTGRKSRGYP